MCVRRSVTTNCNIIRKFAVSTAGNLLPVNRYKKVSSPVGHYEKLMHHMLVVGTWSTYLKRVYSIGFRGKHCKSAKNWMHNQYRAALSGTLSRQKDTDTGMKETITSRLKTAPRSLAYEQLSSTWRPAVTYSAALKVISSALTKAARQQQSF